MRIALGITLILICTIVGIIFGLKYLDRKNFFSDFINFNEEYIRSVSFTGDSIKNILEKNNKSNSHFYEVAYKYFQEKKFSCNYRFITKDEKTFLKEYLESIGRNDYETEKKHANAFADKIKNILSKCEEDEKKYRPLYVKLGFFCGLILFIIIL